MFETHYEEIKFMNVIFYVEFTLNLGCEGDWYTPSEPAYVESVQEFTHKDTDFYELYEDNMDEIDDLLMEALNDRF